MVAASRPPSSRVRPRTGRADPSMTRRRSRPQRPLLHVELLRPRNKSLELKELGQREVQQIPVRKRPYLAVGYWPEAGEARCFMACSPPIRRLSTERSHSASSSPRRRRRRVRRSREGAPAPRPVVRVRPVAPPERRSRASTRPRWPVDAKAPHKTANVFIHRLTRRRGRVGWGFDRRRDRRDAGGCLRSANHHIERGPLASARTKPKLRNPLNPAVQAGFRRTASRRAEPQPTLALTQRGPARSGNSTSATASPDRRMREIPDATGWQVERHA